MEQAGIARRRRRAARIRDQVLRAGMGLETFGMLGMRRRMVLEQVQFRGQESQDQDNQRKYTKSAIAPERHH